MNGSGQPALLYIVPCTLGMFIFNHIGICSWIFWQLVECPSGHFRINRSWNISFKHSNRNVRIERRNHVSWVNLSFFNSEAGSGIPETTSGRSYKVLGWPIPELTRKKIPLAESSQEAFVHGLYYIMDVQALSFLLAFGCLQTDKRKLHVFVWAGTVLILGWWRGELKSLWFKGDSLDQLTLDAARLRNNSAGSRPE